MPLHRPKLSSFKYNKIIYCIMDVIIILIGIGFIFKLSQTNSQIQQLTAMPIYQITCQLCKTTKINFQDEKCCQMINDGLCFNQKSKEKCREQLLAEKSKLAQNYENNLRAICILGAIFFFVECCLESCLGCLLKTIHSKRENPQGKSHLKSGILSTINLQQSCSSMSSFSSLTHSPEKHALQRSFLYNMQEMACPLCLQTMQYQKVVQLQCKHIMHSSCARTSLNCPICS